MRLGCAPKAPASAIRTHFTFCSKNILLISLGKQRQRNVMFMFMFMMLLTCAWRSDSGTTYQIWHQKPSDCDNQQENQSQRDLGIRKSLTPSGRGQLTGWGTETELERETKWGSNSQGSPCFCRRGLSGRISSRGTHFPAQHSNLQ